MFAGSNFAFTFTFFIFITKLALVYFIKTNIVQNCEVLRSTAIAHSNHLFSADTMVVLVMASSAELTFYRHFFLLGSLYYTKFIAGSNPTLSSPFNGL